jgi:hypothetical protein
MYAEGGEVTQSRMMLEQLDADAMAQEPERQESEGLLRNITRGAMDIYPIVCWWLPKIAFADRQ